MGWHNHLILHEKAIASSIKIQKPSDILVISLCLQICLTVPADIIFFEAKDNNRSLSSISPFSSKSETLKINYFVTYLQYYRNNRAIKIILKLR